MKGKSYGAAYKQELLGLLDNSRKAADVAREYGIHVKTIYRWVSFTPARLNRRTNWNRRLRNGINNDYFQSRQRHISYKVPLSIA